MPAEIDSIFLNFPGKPEKTPEYVKLEEWLKQTQSFLIALRCIQDERKAFWIASEHVRIRLYGPDFYAKSESRNKSRVFRMARRLEKSGALNIQIKWITEKDKPGKFKVMYLHTDWQPAENIKKESPWRLFLKAMGGEE